MKIENLKFFVFSGFILVLGQYLQAQEDSTDYSVYDTLSLGYDFFGPDVPFHCTMEFDIKSYQKTKYEGEYLPIKMTYYDVDSMLVEKEFRIKARGNFRRRHCGLPPLWLNIKKTDLKLKQLQDLNKLKMVTHCRGGDIYDQYVLKEYLAYKIYNLITPYSFRVRLTEIKYIDTGRKNKTYTHWAFFIEPEILMNERLNTISLKADNLGVYHTDSTLTDIMAIFQFMIGNADYSIAGRHNIKLIKDIDPLIFYPVPVPYDFDYSGIVNAYYAVPGDNLGIKSVKERYFLGPCRTDQEFSKAIKSILTKESEILDLVKGFHYMNDRDRNEMLKYLSSFFSAAKRKTFIEEHIRSTCRNSSSD